MTDPTKFIKDFKKFLAEPTDEELNKRMHEIIGLCYHTGADSLICSRCIDQTDYDFTKDWSAFGIAWEWIHQKRSMSDFYTILDSIELYLLSPRTLSEAMVEFFKEGAK